MVRHGATCGGYKKRIPVNKEKIKETTVQTNGLYFIARPDTGLSFPCHKQVPIQAGNKLVTQHSLTRRERILLPL